MLSHWLVQTISLSIDTQVNAYSVWSCINFYGAGEVGVEVGRMISGMGLVGWQESNEE